MRKRRRVEEQDYFLNRDSTLGDTAVDRGAKRLKEIPKKTMLQTKSQRENKTKLEVLNE